MRRDLKVHTSWLQKIFLVVLGLLLTEALLYMVGWGYNYVQRTYNPKTIASSTSEKSNESKVILCIGESTTAWGLGDSYPAVLQRKLDALYGSNTYYVINEGVAGSDTQKIALSLESLLILYKPDIVITMVGINDSWQIRGETGLLKYSKLYKLYTLIRHNLDLLKNNQTQKPEEEQALSVEKRNFLKTDYEAIRLLSDSERELLEQAEREFRSKRFLEAVQAYKSALNFEELPNYIRFNLGQALLEIGNKNEAEKFFEDYVKGNPSDLAQVRVASLYHFAFGISDRYGQSLAQKYSRMALQSNPENIEALKILGCSLESQKDTQVEAKGYLEKAIRLGSVDGNVIVSLARIYRNEGRFKDSEKILKIGLNDPTDMGFFIWKDLIAFYQTQKDWVNAEKFVDEALRKYPNNQNLIDVKSEIYKAQGKKYESEGKDIRYWKKNFLLFPPTRENYVQIAKIIEGKKIQHVAMQYPMRSIEELKTLLVDFKSIAFVDNQNNFQTAVEQKGFDAIFNDNFAEDFGHMTPLGSQILVEKLITDLQRQNILPVK
ncbi:GDSL-type esterase/lipase family protein [Pseudobdellovibrio exovorus]|uniref:SGNH hydrolase-type esterase domain-containing protein n=1 Tax=Pseudobdellovibrio exovorus JSS TaxID=1184267 RepID=M4VB01_9BACT|nr:GDSL-type esterase/lipase family protein [Pseudobdellovibrio exovorus]AGH96557.1 hypothetical protein A11Q_2341 [Pseudobdellovibrio exovorus JSS]